MDLNEKKEIIFMSFSQTFDKEIAYQKVRLTGEERKALDKDELFQERLGLVLINEKERIINNLRTFMDSANDRIGFQATLEVAKIIYPEWFSQERDNKPPEKEKETSKKEEERIVEEYGRLIGKRDCFENIN